MEAALENQKNYSFNRTLITSSGTSNMSHYISLGCVSFEQLMNYYKNLKKTQFHRQLGWILYCKLKHQQVQNWGLPSLKSEQAESIKNFIDGTLPDGKVSTWINNQSKRLLSGQILSNRTRLMMSAYFIRDLNLSWKWGQTIWRLILKDGHPLVNAYNWRAQSKNRFLRNYNLIRQIEVHDKVPIKQLNFKKTSETDLNKI